MPPGLSKKAKYQYIPTAKLRFDPGNPRFFGSGHDITKTQEQLHTDLISKFGALKLIDSILVNGFMPYEPLVVRREGSHYSVIEGNRRLAAVKYILAHRSDYPSTVQQSIDSLNKIPCIIFEEAGSAAKTREQTYLGLRHFSGYKSWGAKSKAEYLARQIEAGDAPGELAVKLNTTSSKLKRYLVAISLLKKAGKSVSELPAQNFAKFWLLAEALQRTSIQEYLALEVDQDSFKVSSYDKDRFKKLCRILYGTEAFPEDDQEYELEPVISDTRQISQLAEVLESEEARRSLEKHYDLSLALAYVHKGPEALRELHTSAVEKVQAFLALHPTPSQQNKLKEAIERLLKKK